jgi:hypothetical protein
MNGSFQQFQVAIDIRDVLTIQKLRAQNISVNFMKNTFANNEENIDES